MTLIEARNLDDETLNVRLEAVLGTLPPDAETLDRAIRQRGMFAWFRYREVLEQVVGARAGIDDTSYRQRAEAALVWLAS